MNAEESRVRIDLTALVVGLLYLVIAGLFGLDHTDRIDLDISWIPAVLLIGVGAASVLGSVVDRRR
jgi:hypothetical protein